MERGVYRYLWRRREFNEEDAQLFGTLKPDFYLDLDQGGNENECAGRIFAVELHGESLQLVGSDDWDSKTFRMSAKNVDYEEDRIKVNEVMKAIIMSIRFNQENNVPVEKWGVAHFPVVFHWVCLRRVHSSL